jgi:hypothetical protein
MAGRPFWIGDVRATPRQSTMRNTLHAVQLARRTLVFSRICWWTQTINNVRVEVRFVGNAASATKESIVDRRD